ncbi:hypothetical protein BDV93DRAFT_553892 [Ceratobasidium sp. AG-I]|nr:hypothetical protein BDV93DRAFT_553892 [Ceratobasidium sp. AG-I]
MKNSCIPINSLRPEILVLVFLFVLDASTSAPSVDIFEPFPLHPYDLGYSSRRTKLRKIVTLSSVCVLWRRTALDTGAFWNYAFIALTNERIQLSLDQMSTWLSRAQTIPLEIFLQNQNSESCKSVVDNAILTTPFRSGEIQIQTLSMSLSKSRYINALLEHWFSTGISSTLTKLRIICCDQTGLPVTLRSWLSQCRELQLLQLSDVTLRDDHFPLLPKLVELELASLTPPLTAQRLASVLRGCPNLRRLTLNKVDLEVNTGINVTPVPLQHLRVLNISSRNAAHVLPIVSSGYNALSLTINDFWSDNLINCIGQFSRHSTVIALRLEVMHIEPNELSRLVYSLPQLQTIYLLGLYLDSPTAFALRGVTELSAGGEITHSTFPIPRAIWLAESEIKDEATLRVLVSVRPLQQLKLDYCFLESSGPISEEKDLCSFLVDSIPDLTLTN